MRALSAVSRFPCMLEHALDFFSLHRSHALHTLFRELLSLSDEGLVAWVVILMREKQKINVGGDSEDPVGGKGIKQVETELLYVELVEYWRSIGELLEKSHPTRSSQVRLDRRKR